MFQLYGFYYTSPLISGFTGAVRSVYPGSKGTLRLLSGRTAAAVQMTGPVGLRFMGLGV